MNHRINRRAAGAALLAAALTTIAARGPAATEADAGAKNATSSRG
ncbi:hypothetical protein [Streptomyces sp. NPDC004788]